MVNAVRDQTDPFLKAKVEKYEAENWEPQTAREQAMVDMIPYDTHQMLKKYQIFLQDLIQLRRSKLHRCIVGEIEQKISEGVEETRAIKGILRSHIQTFHDFLAVSEDEDTGNESDTEENSDTEQL